jgi:hypothetical protein
MGYQHMLLTIEFLLVNNSRVCFKYENNSLSITLMNGICRRKNRALSAIFLLKDLGLFSAVNELFTFITVYLQCNTNRIYDQIE